MQRPRLLIVNDDPALVRAIIMALTSLDRYDIRSLTDPSQALRAVLEFRPDLVILDWTMPEMNGGEAARLIRSDPSAEATRMLILSSTIANQKVRTQIEGIPAIAKPVGLHHLVEAIEDQISDGSNA